MKIKLLQLCAGLLFVSTAFTQDHATTNVGFVTDFPAAKVDIAGTVKITNGTEGVGKVLTSDLAGNAAWQDLITPDMHLSAGSFVVFTIPSSTEQTLINWGNLDEAGGTNWNAKRVNIV